MMHTITQPEGRERDGAGGDGDGVDMDVNSELNAAKHSLNVFRKQSSVAVCSDFMVHCSSSSKSRLMNT